MTFKILEDLATADVAFEATGKTVEEMIKSSALALTSVMAKLDTIVPDTKKNVDISEKDVETLLVRFLNEIIFLKDSDLLLFSKYNINVKKEGSKYKLKAVLHGQKIDMEKQIMGVDVKAVTYHMLKVEQFKDKWKARIILDI
jgi:SHS2 domain-containing protein